MSGELNDFETKVLERSRQVPVLVDFWAPWCAPCRTLGPILERLAFEANGRWELAKFNTEEHQELAATFNIASIPAVKLFVNGEVKAEFVGALPEREIRRFLERSIPSPHASKLTEAQERLKEGNSGAALGLLEELLAVEPENQEARVRLAELLLELNPDRVAHLLSSIEPDSDLAAKADALRTLARLAQLTQNPAGLPQNKVRDRYLEGALAIKSADYEAALNAFIEVLEKDKTYDNSGAKEACKAVFQLLGMRHTLSERFFRRFSGALHS